MTDPVLHLLAGPNGAGKSTFFARVLGPITHLRFVNADEIAAAHWPGREVEHAYEAAAIAADERQGLIEARQSFVTETVFSHESKVELLRRAEAAGYRTMLHILMVPVDLAVVRVALRVEEGGHDVPEDKIRGRHARLWSHVREAIGVVDEAIVYDSSSAVGYRRVASYLDGHLVGEPEWPPWAPDALKQVGRGRRATGIDPGA